MEEKVQHTKMDNLWFGEVKMQSYLKTNKFTVQEAQTVFSFRTRMAKFSENYRENNGPVTCPLWHLHLDSQQMAFQCQIVKANVKLAGHHDSIYSDNISKEIGTTLRNISQFRQTFLEERKLQWTRWAIRKLKNAH